MKINAHDAEVGHSVCDNLVADRDMNIRSLLVCASFIPFSAQAMSCDTDRPEDFATFFTNFSSDKSFATSRTVYPSARVRYEYAIEDGKQQITEVRRNVTKQEDMKYPPVLDYMKSYGYEPTQQQISRTQAVMELFKPDAGFVVSYHFVLRQGCWFLQEIQHHSL